MTGDVDASRYWQCDASQRPDRLVLSSGGSDTSVQTGYMQSARGLQPVKITWQRGDADMRCDRLTLLMSLTEALR
jgi:hypothetical protein